MRMGIEKRCVVLSVAAVSALLAAATEAADVCPVLFPGKVCGAHDGPYFIAPADFNGDGITDLAVANVVSDDVSILLGNGSGGVGNGTFGDPAHYPAHDAPRSLTTGDFNGDGITDIAVANEGSHDVSILLGKDAGGVGDGTFEAPQHCAAGTAPQSVTAGDFNGDQITDLAVVCMVFMGPGHSVSILLGNGTGGVGDGTFGDPEEYPVHHRPQSVTIGDFNGDGITDLVVANADSDDVSILLGNGAGGLGDGTFGDSVHYPAHEAPQSVTTGDFNGDGITDLAVANMSTSDVSILLGNGSEGVGDGTFGGPVHYPAHASPESVVTGDFNSDGIADLAVANQQGVSILLGNGADGVGDGTFGDAVRYLGHNTTTCLCTADFNGDGITDLAVANMGSDDVRILLGNGAGGIGDGTFGTPHYPAHGRPTSVTTGDFNGDGITDLAVANVVSCDVSILLGNGSGDVGNGTFGAPQHYVAGNTPQSVTTGDFNGDGITDLAVVSEIFEGPRSSVCILLGNGTGGAGDGTFGDPEHYPAEGLSVTTGDFNGDGITDLAVADTLSGEVSILLGNGSEGVGDGTFGDPVAYPAHGLPSSVTTGDFNSDGITDLAVTNGMSSDVSILLGNGAGGVGDGTFGDPAHYPANTMPRSVATGDFNGDGMTDLAVANGDSGGVSILLGGGTGGVGDGTFEAPVHYPAHDQPHSVTTADFNGDGITDLAAANWGTDDVSILPGNGSGGVGDGTFGDPVHYRTQDGPSSVTTGDFNGDGRTDLAVANSESDDISILLNLCEKAAGPEFIRGDCNPDGSLKLADAIYTLLVVFRPGFEVPCRKACDFDDDNKVALTDAIQSLTYIFVPDTAAAPAPFPHCGHDPSLVPAPGELPCGSFPPCE